nr:glycosyltransferase [Gluconacetobacter tumulisoli]
MRGLAAGTCPDVAYDGRQAGGQWHARDGVLVLSGTWREAARIDVTVAGAPLLGSPLDPAALLRVEGVVEPDGDGLAGWAWHPADPDHVARLRILSPADGRVVLRVDASDRAVDVDSTVPLARPRRFSVAGTCLPAGPVRVVGPDGGDLTGSPVDPACPAAPPAAISPDTGPLVPGRRVPVAIVVPVHGDRAATLACLASVRDSAGPDVPVWVVDDATPDGALAADLDRLAAAGTIRLIRHARTMGFPVSANDGMRAAAGHDVVLLNSDTLVAGGWLAELVAVAYGAPDIGTVTPLSNDATIFSWPGPDRPDQPAPVPDLARVRHLMAAARAANGGQAVTVPTGHGFCLFIRHDCLARAGLFRADLFAQGYGEENEFCRRAAALGWRHVAAPGAFVGHVGSASFGAARSRLLRRNLAIVNRLHPGYDALVAAHIAADPLFAARRRLDLVCWRRAGARWTRAVLLVTHAQGGGVERVVQARARAWRRSGMRAIVLRPDATGCRLEDGGTGDDAGGARDDGPAPRFRLPAERAMLLTVLRASGVEAVEWHHRLGHRVDADALAAELAVPYDVHVHDYMWFCPRIALVGPAGRYCGEPGPEGCAACVARTGSLLEGGRDDPDGAAIPALLARSRTALSGARAVIVPSDDSGRRMRRHFPGLVVRVTPLEDDRPDLSLAAFARLAGAGADPRPMRGGRVRVAVIGAIGVEKGYDILLAAARDAATRRLDLEFVVVGHTPDDDALMQTGRVFVTGAYHEAEALSLLCAQQADIALLPSVWPETWCFTLGLAWRAGLRVVAYDFGAVADRIRRTGRGIIVPPGLPIHELNTIFLSCGRPRRRRRMPSGQRGDLDLDSCAGPSVFADRAPAPPPGRRGRRLMSDAVLAGPGGGQGRVTDLKVAGHLMTLDSGLYCIFHAPGQGTSTAGGLPGVRISPPPGPAGGAASIVTFDADGWLGSERNAALVRVPAGPAQVLITIYQDPAAVQGAPKLQVVRLADAVRPGAPVPVSAAAVAPGPAPQAVPAGIVPSAGAPADGTPGAELTAHIQRRGDVAASLGEWMGKPGSQAWIEGFAISPASQVTAGDIEYQAVLGRGWLSPWASGGQFCGSRGMALPVLGLRVRLKGAAAGRFACTVAATFTDGTSVGPVGEGRVVEAESLAPLEAFRVEIVPVEEAEIPDALEAELLAAVSDPAPDAVSDGTPATDDPPRRGRRAGRMARPETKAARGKTSPGKASPGTMPDDKASGPKVAVKGRTKDASPPIDPIRPGRGRKAPGSRLDLLKARKRLASRRS